MDLHRRHAPPTNGRPSACRWRRRVAALAEIEPVLDLVEAAPPVEAVEVLAEELRPMVGAVQVCLLVADFSGDAVVRFIRAAPPGRATGGCAGPPGVDAPAGQPYERVLFTQELEVVAEGGRYRLFAPVTERGEALGVLELSLPTSPDAATLRSASAAHALAYVLIATRRHTDLFEWAQRTCRFSLAAEIQRRLLPPSYTLEAGAFTLAGWLEPASTSAATPSTTPSIATPPRLHLRRHGPLDQAALLATLRSAASQQPPGRRRPARASTRPTPPCRAPTGRSSSPGCSCGCTWPRDGRAVNAGHPEPFLLRNGRVSGCRSIRTSPSASRPPLPQQHFVLEPGDRLLVVTDGFLERAEACGHLDVAAALVETAALHPREMVHVFKSSVLAATEAELGDDASLLCIDWHGPAAGPRPAGDGG